MTSQKPSPEVFERAFRRWRTEILQRPTIGEYPVYDEHLYRWMMDDPVRTAAYRKAIGAAVRGKRVLDLGTGAQAFLAVMCAKAARATMTRGTYPCVSRRSPRIRQALGLENIITVHCGTSFDVQVSPPADICVSEIIGMIGSAEGVQSSLRDAVRFSAGRRSNDPAEMHNAVRTGNAAFKLLHRCGCGRRGATTSTRFSTRSGTDSRLRGSPHSTFLQKICGPASPHPFEILEFSATHADATTEMSGRTRTRFAW